MGGRWRTARTRGTRGAARSRGGGRGGVTPAAVGIYSVEIPGRFTRENAKARASFDAAEGVGGDPKRPASEDRGGGRFLVVRVQKFTARRRPAFLLGGRGDPAAVSGFSLPASFSVLTCGVLGRTTKTRWRSLTGQTPKRAGSTGRTGKRARRVGGTPPPGTACREGAAARVPYGSGGFAVGSLQGQNTRDRRRGAPSTFNNA
jgi:hypothetical protein